MAVTVRWKKIKRGESAQLVIHKDNRRFYETLGIHLIKGDPENKNKRKQVEQKRAQRELDLGSSEIYQVPEYKQRQDFVEYFEQYQDSYKKKDIRKVRYSLKKFKSFLEEKELVQIQFREITPKLCSDFKDYLTNPANGLSAETPYDYWKRFKGVLKMAKMEKILNDNPADGITFKGYNKYEKQLRKNILTPVELQSIASKPCANNEVKRAFLFACYTGLGMAEIRQLTWARIENGRITLFREKNGEQVNNNLHPVAIQLLGVAGRQEEFVFKCPSDPTVSKVLKSWVKSAGIDKNISFYCGRHVYAVNLLNGENNLKTVADCMGQTSTKHTMKYLNFTDPLKVKAIASLPEINLG